MRISKSTKSLLMKIFSTVLVAVFLFSTSSITVILPPKKALEASTILGNENESPINLSSLVPSATVAKIAAGGNYSLALMSDGTVWAWGANSYGQLGNGSTAASVPPVQVLNLTDVIAIAAGDNHSLAVKSDGTVWAWGLNSNGQLGEGTTTQRLTPVKVSNLTGVVSVSAGSAHSLALKSDGTVWAWGLNTNGRLGDGTTTQRNAPVQVTSLSNVTSVSAGGSHSMALKADKTVWAWGLNTNGQLGDNTVTQRLTPVQTTIISSVAAIDGGATHSLAVKSDGTVWAWGNNTNGRLGDGTTTQRNAPVQVTSLSNVTSVFAGGSHSLALRLDGTIWAWGNNASGQLGDGTSTQRLTPVQVLGVNNATKIAIGSNHSLVLRADGRVWAWGANSSYQLGDWSTLNRNVPVQIIGVSEVTGVAAGTAHSLMVLSDGTVWAWGLNTNGQLGDGTTITRYAPVQVSGLTGIIAVAAGASHSLALKSDGTVWAWGNNTNGRLGDGTTTQRLTPVQVSNLTGVTSISAGGSHSMALRSDKTVWTWGLNSNGQLGDNTTTQRLAPVQTTIISSIVAISGGASHSLALKSDGTVWAWGINTNGRLGDGTATQRNAPVQVSSLTGVSSIAAGGAHSMALKSDGTVWAWGLNTNGQLGDNTLTQRAVPVNVSTLSSVTAIAAGATHSLAVKADGTMWAWGLNTNGQLGDNSVTQRNVPVQVSALTKIAKFAAGSTHSLAVKQNGTAWICGYGSNDRLPSSNVPVRSHVGAILPEAILFEQSSYLVLIPETSGNTSTVTMNAVAVDMLGQSISGIDISFHLAQPYTGVSINSTTGVVTINHTASQGTVSIKAICEGTSAIVVLKLIIPSGIVFTPDSYGIVLPDSGSPSSTTTAEATAVDMFGRPLSGPNIVYGLNGSFTGVSINSVTGVVSVDSTASAGIVELTASSYGLTTSAQLYILTRTQTIAGEIILQVTGSEYYDVSTWAYEIDDFDGLFFVLTYDALMLAVYDLSSLTWGNELSAGKINGTGITIISFTPGEIIFTFEASIPSNMSWTGITNAFRFKALNVGATTLYLYEAVSGASSRGNVTSSSEERSRPSLTAERTQPDKELSIGRELSYDKRGMELLGRISDYNEFTDEDKEYIQNFLGLSRTPTEEELYFIAKWQKEQEERQNNISPEVILFDLIEGKTTFDTISSSDWAKIKKFFSNLTDTQIKELTAKGLSVKDILQINIAMQYGMFGVAEAELLLKIYPNDSERASLVFDLYVSTVDCDAKVQQAARTMFLDGINVETIKSTLKLESAVRSVAINLETGEVRINASGSSPTRGNSGNGESDPVAPFTVSNGTDESIDLNTGNLRYVHDILNLPGVNGFDLNLALVYNSSDSALYLEGWDENWYVALWYVPCQEQLYINGVLYNTWHYEEYFYDYWDAVNFQNAFSSGGLIDYQQGWDFVGSVWVEDYWDNYMLLLVSWDDPNDTWIYFENPAPGYLYFSFDDGNYRFSGFIPAIAGPFLTYFYCDDDPFHAYHVWCYEYFMIWTTYYGGYLPMEAYLVYETYLFSGGVYEAYWDCEYINKTYNKGQKNQLGAGWDWNLPSINGKTLNLGNGQSFTIGEYDSFTNTYALSNHALQDFVLKQNTSYNNGQYISHYVLEHKNGDKIYFDYYGRLLAQVDRYGNTITYKYTFWGVDTVLSQIIDSAGRIVNFTYVNTTTGRTVTVTAPDGSQIVITLDKVSWDMAQCVVKRITDAQGNQAQFNYSISPGSFNLSQEVNAYAADGYNYWALLTEIVYPTAAKKVFTYTKYTDFFGDYGHRQFFKITARKDVIGSTNYNVKTYSYTGSNNGGGAYDPNDLPSGYTYSTTVTDSNDSQNVLTSTYVFNDKHLQISETIKNNNVLVASTTTDYHATYKLPIAITSRTYNSSGSYMETILLYEYDARGNITAFWNEQANGNKANTDFKTTYVYDTSSGNFNQLLSKTYKQNASTTICESHTLTVDKKSISITEILVNNVVKTKKQFLYNSRGEVTSERAFKDGFVNYVETFYVYDAHGNLVNIINTGIKDVDGNLVAGTPGVGSAAGRIAVTFVYNIMGKLISYTDARGNTTTYQYDVLGRVTKVIHADSTFQTMGYDDANNILTITNELGNQKKYFYDGFGNLLRVYDATVGQFLTTNTYDAKMRLATSNNHNNSANSVQTTYTYDYMGRVISQQTKDKNGVVVAWQTSTYDNAANGGQYQKVTHTVVGDVNAPSNVSSIYFNKSGLLEKQSRTFNNVEYFDYFTYDYVGNLLTEKTAIAVQNYNQVPYTAKYEYDFAGRVIKQYNVAGVFATFVYDALGNLISSTDYAANASGAPYSTTYVYDDMGRLIQENIPMEKNGGTIYYSVNKYFYDANSNIIKEQYLTSIPGQSPTYSTVEYQYNNRDLPVKTIQYDGITEYYATYTYYPNGLMESVTIGNGASTFTYVYDHAGRLTVFTDALGKSETISYDTNGNVISKTDRNGWVTTFTYDGLGRVLTTNVSTGNSATDVSQSFTYTLSGALLSENNGAFTATYTYDELGRLISVSESNDVTKFYTYDIADNLLSYVLKVFNVVEVNTGYVYDYFNRVATVKEDNVTVATYTYDVNGNRATTTYANGTSTAYAYNLANMPTSVVNKEGNTVISSYAYNYYLDGNTYTKTDHTGLVTTYEYDGLGRLTLEEESISNVVQQSWAYSYNASHNRTSMVTYTPSLTFVTEYKYDLNNRLLKESKATGNGWDITNYTYDNNGSQTIKYYQWIAPSSGGTPSIGLQSGGMDTFIYDGLNRLIAANVNDVEATYTYKADGLRISKTVDGITTKHIWNGNKISIELNASDAVIAKYIHGLNLIAAESNGFRTYYLFDAHGDVTHLTDSLGAVLRAYRYNAYGVEINPNPNDSNPFRYCGEYFDEETGNYYLRARYYDPRIGRFITEDPIRYSLNWYTYANNNPVLFNDPTGLFFNKIAKAVSNAATAVVNTVSTAVTATVTTVAAVTTAVINTAAPVVASAVTNATNAVSAVLEPVVAPILNAIMDIAGPAALVSTDPYIAASSNYKPREVYSGDGKVRSDSLFVTITAIGGITLAIGRIVDSQGNSGFCFSPSINMGTPMYAIGHKTTEVSAASIDDIRGWGGEVGATIILGGDFVFTIGDEPQNRGYAVSTGAGIPLDVHANFTYTWLFFTSYCE